MSATANGQPVDSRSLMEQAKDARLRVRLLRDQIVAKRLERSRAIMEASPTDVSSISDWMSAFSDLVSRFRNEPNSYQISTLYDRRYGRNYPFYQTEVELGLIRMGSRIQAQTNPYGIGLMRGLRCFVIADHFTYRATSEDDKEPVLSKAVQRIIDRHLERNQWCGGEKGSREHELFNNSIMDGEFFLRHYAREDGWTDTRLVLAEQVRQPGGWSNEEGMFGVRHSKNDIEDIISYWVTYTGHPPDGEEVDAKEIIHLPRNRPDRTVLRGCPEYAFDTFDALDSANKLSKAMGVGSTIHARLTGIREHQSAQETSVQSFADGLADYQRPDLATGMLLDYTKYYDGQFLDIPQSLKFLDPPGYKQGAQPFVEILHALLRKAGVRWNAPEWLATSSGADMAAYTASLTAESPFVRSIESEQKTYQEAYRKSVWIAVENFIRHHGGILRVPVKQADGRTEFREYTLDEIRRLITIQVEAKPAQVRNKLEETQRDQVLNQMHAKSIQTIQQEQGLDSDREATNFEEWEERFGSAGNPLQLPPDEGNSEGGEGSAGDGDKPNPTDKAKTLPTAESVHRLVESRQRELAKRYDPATAAQIVRRAADMLEGR